MSVLDFSLPVVQHTVMSRIAVDFDNHADQTMWITMKPAPAAAIHNFSLPLLNEMYELVHNIQAGAAHWHHEGRIVPVHYAVMRSADPEYFNAGGDLGHFRRCIGAGDRNGLYDYAMLCLDVLFGWAGCSHGDISTIALVQGRALGGGFEAALSADYLIAEEHSSFGFPEIMFGLFPCTGAMSLLSRRVGPGIAERMMTNRKIYGARELLDMGIVDAVCERGQGMEETRRFIACHARRRRARQMVERSRRRQAPLDYGELSTVVAEWVSLAMKLSAEELRVMDMLIGLQRGRVEALRTGCPATP
jgi:DSF synthase